jgi:hypothetical protein
MGVDSLAHHLVCRSPATMAAGLLVLNEGTCRLSAPQHMAHTVLQEGELYILTLAQCGRSCWWAEMPASPFQL